MSSSLTDFSPDYVSIPLDLRGSSQRDLGLLLLKRVALNMGETFREDDLRRGTIPGDDPNGLAPAIPRKQVNWYIQYLLDSSLPWILKNGYIAETSPGSAWLEVTPKGWAALGIDPDDDDCIFKIFPEDRARWLAENGQV